MFRTLTIFLFAVLAVAAACTRQPETRILPYDQLQEGDLAFRCGHGILSRAVTTAQEQGMYSHLGVVVRDGDVWKVVHAVPAEHEFNGDFDRVKQEDIAVFYSPERASRGCLVHTGFIDSAQLQALRIQALQAACDSVRFDHGYNLNDSSEMYCAEFVWHLYRSAGIDLSEGRRRSIHLLQIDGDILLPEHLLAYSNNIPYFQF